MKLFRLSVFLPLVALFVVARPSSPQAQSEQTAPRPQPAIAPPAGSVVVYVSDFDLDVANHKPSPKPVLRASPGSNSGSSANPRSGVKKNAPSAPASATPQVPESPENSTEETPADRANALVNAMSENLIRALTQAGYDGRRLPSGAPLPKQGLRIRGVFAEADERNRARRLLVGGQPVSANMILFVGVNNLARPEQPLYELAVPPDNDPSHGPVITVTSYAPASRFELSRDPSGEEFRKIATQIAADFTALLNANRLSSPQ